MAPPAHGQMHSPLLSQASIELSQGLDDTQPSPHRSLRVIFVRQRVAEVDEQAVAEVLGNIPLIAGDHLGTGLLIGAYHLAQVFGIELTGEAGRVDQVSEEHRELAPLGFREWRSS